MVSIAWVVAIAIIAGLAGFLLAALLASNKRREIEAVAEKWAAEHAKVATQYAELDERAQNMFGKLCKLTATVKCLNAEVAALKGEPVPGQPKAAGTAEEVASIIRDLGDDCGREAGRVLDTMEATG